MWFSWSVSSDSSSPPGAADIPGIEVRAVHRLPARAAVFANWPEWLPATVVEALNQSGVAQPWAHQVEAAEAVYAGRHVMITTGTASGKSLGFGLPILAATAAGQQAHGGLRAPAPPTTGPKSWVIDRRPHTALYLSPTKALAHDQLRSWTTLAIPGWQVGTLDGDSTSTERLWARDHGTFLLTNPDLLHLSLLPNHVQWSGFMKNLRYVVVDEAHRYRGVFGAQVSAVLRRLRRIAAHYGADPVVVLASATTASPANFAAGLIGVSADEITMINTDASARGSVEITLGQPESLPEECAAQLLADRVRAGRQSLAFVGSRRGAEAVALGARRRLPAGSAKLIDAYRAGYLAHDRRRLEAELRSRAILGLAATNALELGVDIAGLDSVIMTGYPGTRSAFWQQAGRAGRSGQAAEVIMLGRPHPVDRYLLEHPEELFGPAAELPALHPENPTVLGPQLCAAAQEIPLSADDEAWFGPSLMELIHRLVASGMLRARPGGWFWTRTDRAVDLINLRVGTSATVEIIESETGRVLGQVDEIAADWTVHDGAVYVHRGETYTAVGVDVDHGEAMVTAARPGYLTQAKGLSGVRIAETLLTRSLGAGKINFGPVVLTSQVTGYLRRDEQTLVVWDETPLDLPERQISTQGCWWTLDLTSIDEDLTLVQIGAGMHALEHLLVGLLPLITPCDPWDVRGHSAVNHAQTERPTLFVVDSQPGGAGFAETGYAAAERWLTTARDRIRSCACPVGCPACVVSATCSRTQVGLDKPAALRLLEHFAG